MGIPAEPVAAADQKKSAREYVEHYYSNTLQHLFKDNAHLRPGYQDRKCVLHGNKPCSIRQIPIACASGGMPCQPFSKNRQTSGHSRLTGAAAEHPGWQTIFQDFGMYLDEAAPAQFWIEEILEFEVYLAEFCRMCASHGYCVRALVLDHADFCELARPRCIHIGKFGVDGGGLA